MHPRTVLRAYIRVHLSWDLVTAAARFDNKPGLWRLSYRRLRQMRLFDVWLLRYMERAERDRALVAGTDAGLLRRYAETGYLRRDDDIFVRDLDDVAALRELAGQLEKKP